MHVCTVLMFLSSRNYKYNTYLLMIQSSPRQTQSIMFIIVFFVLKMNAFGSKYIGYHTILYGLKITTQTVDASLGPNFLVTIWLKLLQLPLWDASSWLHIVWLKITTVTADASVGPNFTIYFSILEHCRMLHFFFFCVYHLAVMLDWFRWF